MKTTGLLTNTIKLLSVATIAGLSNSAFAADPAAPKSEVTWKEIGTAPGIVGMAAVGKNLFAITSAKKLQVCEPATTPVVWKEIGDGPGGNVVAMGTSDGKLFASTDARSAGRLAVRDAATTAAAWQDQGHAWCLVGMAGAVGKMYAIVDTKELGSEPTISPGGVVAMGVADGKLFASTYTRSGTLHLREAVESAAAWQHIGHCWCCVGMAGTAKTPGKIYGAIVVNNGAAGVAESIMVRATTPADVPWATAKAEQRPPLGILAFAEVAGKFYAVTREDNLFVSGLTQADNAWRLLGDAAGVTILAGGDGKLFATTKAGRLLMWQPK